MSAPIRRLTDAELARLAEGLTPEGLVTWEGEIQDALYDAAPALVRELVELRAMRDALLELGAGALPKVSLTLLRRTLRRWRSS